MNYRITIGEFSKLSGLSRKVLRLYEEQGLLKPIFIDPTTGYRYYAPIQVVESERIQALRMLDMPLSEIYLFLNERNPEVLRELLGEYRNRLERRVSSMRRTLDFLDQLTELREEIFVGYTVIVKDLEEQAIVSTRMITTLAQVGESMEEAFGRLYKYREMEGLESSGVCMSLYHCQEFDPEHMDVEVATVVDRPCAEREGLTYRLLPQCTVVEEKS
ncbi:MAG: hypothetical protein CSA35_05240 [Dethiosulfovibrio peptidovorans]|nr:MAG: hypothetical protein CSA35_05240 [Dethiosulfovibrio peptidovorans]